MRRFSFARSVEVLLVHLLVLGLLVVLCALRDSVGVPPDMVIRPACMALIAISIWSLWSWYRVTGGYFDPYVLFWISAVLFNGGQAFLEIFSLNENGLLAGVLSSEIVLRTLILVILGLATFHLGGLTAVAAARGFGRKNNSFRQDLGMATNSRIVGWGLLAVSFIPAIFLIREAAQTVTDFGYIGLYQREGAVGFEAAPAVLGAFLVPASLFLLAGSKEHRLGRIVSAAIIYIYFLTHMFLGSRSAAAMPLVAYAWIWHRHIRPLSISLLLGAGVVLLAIFFPLIQLIRNLSGEDRFSLPFLVETLLNLEHPAVAVLSEMGGSMGTVAHTIDLVPGARLYDLGTGYIYAFSTIVPNLFWDIHPAVAHGLAGNWLTWMVDPFTARMGGGLGYSFIAEAYLNFGWFGAPIVLGVIGFLFGKYLCWGERVPDPARLAAVAAFLAFFLKFARSETATVIRPLVWYSLFPYLLVRVLGWHRSLKRRPASLRQKPAL